LIWLEKLRELSGAINQKPNIEKWKEKKNGIRHCCKKYLQA
jgi:hypothetical protein